MDLSVFDCLSRSDSSDSTTRNSGECAFVWCSLLVHIIDQGTITAMVGDWHRRVFGLQSTSIYIVSVVTSLSVWIILASLTDYTYTDRKVVCCRVALVLRIRRRSLVEAFWTNSWKPPDTRHLLCLLGSDVALLRRLLFVSARYLVDPASSHMLVSKIKPCMSKYKPN